MNMTEALATTLQAERAAAKLTYDQVAEKSGLSKSSVVRYFTGARPIDVADLARVAVHLGKTPGQLVVEAEARMAGPAPSLRQAEVLKALGATDEDIARLTQSDHPIAGGDQDESGGSVAGRQAT